MNVTAGALRASVNGWDQAPPRISVEGDDVTFAAGAGRHAVLADRRQERCSRHPRRPRTSRAASVFGIDGGAASAR